MSDFDNDPAATDLPGLAHAPLGQTTAAPAAGAGKSAPARATGGWSWILWLLVLAGAGYMFWRVQMVEHGQDRVVLDEQTTLQKLNDRTDALQREVAAARHDSEALRARLDDATKVNESLRAQLLGLTERARLAEEAIANLADKRLSGHDSLLLNEAELLLVLGGERYRLFHDPAPAIVAYRLADTALAEANNAAFSTIRQSISAEIGALAGTQPVDVAATAEQLGQLRARLARLQVATAADKPAAEPTSRWAQIFGEFVRVSRDDDTRELLSHSDPLLARALVDANLRDAQAALLLRDTGHFHRGVAAAREHFAGSFDAKDVAVSSELASLDALAKIELAAPAPDVLGTALKELRNLRTTQALHPEPAPPAAAEAPGIPPGGATKP
jgi:uroporphyrin-3 C-methyltransferase